MSSGSSFNYPLEDHGEHRHASSGHGDKHLSDFNHPPSDFDEPGGKPRDAINDKMMVSPIVIFLVLLFAFLFNVFARWFWLWRQSARLSTRNRRRSASRLSTRNRRRPASIRRQFNFTGEEPARLLNVGLDSEVLKTLPIFIYRSQNFTDGLDCAICLCELEENEKARLLPNCGHSFHVECIDMWFRSHSTCPLCRTVAQPEQPVLESATTEQVSVRIPGPGFHNNLNLGQEQTVSCGEDYNLQNPTNIFSWGRQKHMKTEMDEGTSNGGALMPRIAIDIPKRSDGFLSGKGIHLHSPNSSQSSSNSPIPRLRSFTRMFSTDTEKRLPN